MSGDVAAADPGRLLARWERLRPDPAVSWAALGADLLRRYAEPHRHHHDRGHLCEVLDTVDRLVSAAADADAVRLAAWFHDAVYDPTRDDNEELSAELAERSLPSYRVAPTRVGAVARLVRLTRTHDPDAGDPDGAVLCDADLAVLAAPPARYRQYAAAVRREYRHLDDEAFRRGRLRVLSELRSRDPLYRTAVAVGWTAAARRNLDGEAAQLCADLA